MRRLLLALLLLLLAASPLVAAGPEPPTHVVAAGETLAAISQRYGVSLQALIEANDIADPNYIYIGQRLIIPAGSTQAPALPAGRRVYRMQPGDSLPRLARRFDLDPAAILAANGISHPRLLELEEEILLPEAPQPGWPSPFLAVTHSPAIVQGQTGLAGVTLARPQQPAGTFGERELHFFYRDKTREGYRYWALLPTGALAAPGERSLRIEAGEAAVAVAVPIVAGRYETQYIILPPAKGELLEPTRVRNELEVLGEVWAGRSERKQWRGPFRFPIAEGFIPTSPYGTRRSYNNGPVSSYHAGSDWSAPEGTPISAPAAGTVALAEMLDVRGGAVVIDHGLGVYSNFWHLSAIGVTPGQQVRAGEVIGEVGTTGLSTGAHLHWELRVDGLAVDPLQWTGWEFPYAPVVEARAAP